MNYDLDPIAYSVKQRTTEDLENLRKKAQITDEQLAEYLGCSRATWQRMKKERQPLPLAFCSLYEHLAWFTKTRAAVPAHKHQIEQEYEPQTPRM